MQMFGKTYCNNTISNHTLEMSAKLISILYKHIICAFLCSIYCLKAIKEKKNP